MAKPLPKRTPSGATVRWTKPSVTLFVDPSMRQVAEDPAGLVASAIDTWRATGAPLPEVTVAMGDGTEADEPDANVIRYEPNGFAPAKGALAVTLTTFDDDTGELRAANIVLDGKSRHFGVLPDTIADGDDREPAHGEMQTYDVPSVVTHELGHFFGLADDYEDDNVTMYVSTRAGTTTKRALTEPDTAAIRELYDGSNAGADAHGCSFGGAAKDEGGLAAAFVFALAAVRRRRRMSR